MLPPQVLGSHNKVLSRGGTGSSLSFPQTPLASSGGEVGGGEPGSGEPGGAWGGDQRMGRRVSTEDAFRR